MLRSLPPENVGLGPSLQLRKYLVRIFVVLVCASSVWLPLHIPPVRASTSPTVSGAVVDNFQSSLTLASGSSLYLYGLVTGGAYYTSGFANGEYASVTDASGYIIAALAITTSNSNSYTTQTFYPAIGGVSVSGFASYTSSYGGNNSPAASSASDTFTVSVPGSLVVVVADAGGEQSLAVSGLSGLTVDATNFNGSCNQGIPPVIWIGHALPATGTYTVTETTSQCAAGQDPNHAGDLIGVFVFSGSGTESQGVQAYVPITLTNNQPTATSSQFQQMLTFNPSSYSTYEASDLGNVRFCNDSSCNTQLFAWLESCNATCGPSAGSAGVWVLLPPPIPGNGGTLTIYLAFYSTSTEFDGNYWGEAPLLSSSYAQFDNGAHVFSTLYENFAGAALPSGWSQGSSNSGSVSVNNGLSVSTGGSTVSGAVAQSNISASSGVVEGLVSSFSNGGNSQVMAVVAATSSSFSGANLLGYQPDSVGWQNGSPLEIENNNGGTPSVVATSTVNPSAPFVIGIYSGTLYVNYGIGATVSGNILGNGNLAIEVNSGTTVPAIQYDWIRVRAYPPSGNMPGASFGSVASANSLSLSFVETGLPTTTQWSVSLNGASQSSNTNTISFNESPGTYSYSVSSAGGLNPLPGQGSATLQSNLVVNIHFSGSFNLVVVNGTGTFTLQFFVDNSKYQSITGFSGVDQTQAAYLYNFITSPTSYPVYGVQVFQGNQLLKGSTVSQVVFQTLVWGWNYYAEQTLSTTYQQTYQNLQQAVDFQPIQQGAIITVKALNLLTFGPVFDALTTLLGSTDALQISDFVSLIGDIIDGYDQVSSIFPQNSNQILKVLGNYGLAAGSTYNPLQLDYALSQLDPSKYQTLVQSLYLAAYGSNLDSSAQTSSGQTAEQIAVQFVEYLGHTVVTTGLGAGIQALVDFGTAYFGYELTAATSAAIGSSTFTTVFVANIAKAFTGPMIPITIAHLIVQDFLLPQANDLQSEIDIENVLYNKLYPTLFNDLGNFVVNTEANVTAGVNTSYAVGLVQTFTSMWSYVDYQMVSQELFISCGSGNLLGNCRDSTLSFDQANYNNFMKDAFDIYSNLGQIQTIATTLALTVDPTLSSEEIAPVLQSFFTQFPLQNVFMLTINSTNPSLLLRLGNQSFALNYPNSPITLPFAFSFNNGLNATGLIIFGSKNGSYSLTMGQASQVGFYSMNSSKTTRVGQAFLLRGQTTFFTLQGSHLTISRIATSIFFTDFSNHRLPIDSSGSPEVVVVLSNGRVKGTIPNPLLLWVNITDTGPSALQSFKINETLPMDWVIPGVSPGSTFHLGPISITISGANPEILRLTISNFTAILGHPLMPGKSIVLQLPVVYKLIGTSQLVTSYPRTYTTVASAAAWTQASFSGTDALATGSSIFIAYSKAT